MVLANNSQLTKMTSAIKWRKHKFDLFLVSNAELTPYQLRAKEHQSIRNHGMQYFIPRIYESDRVPVVSDLSLSSDFIQKGSADQSIVLNLRAVDVDRIESLIEQENRQSLSLGLTKENITVYKDSVFALNHAFYITFTYLIILINAALNFDGMDSLPRGDKRPIGRFHRLSLLEEQDDSHGIGSSAFGLHPAAAQRTLLLPGHALLFHCSHRVHQGVQAPSQANIPFHPPQIDSPRDPQNSSREGDPVSEVDIPAEFPLRLPFAGS